MYVVCMYVCMYIYVCMYVCMLCCYVRQKQLCREKQLVTSVLWCLNSVVCILR